MAWIQLGMRDSNLTSSIQRQPSSVLPFMMRTCLGSQIFLGKQPSQSSTSNQVWLKLQSSLNVDARIHHTTTACLILHLQVTDQWLWKMNTAILWSWPHFCCLWKCVIRMWVLNRTLLLHLCSVGCINECSLFTGGGSRCISFHPGSEEPNWGAQGTAGKDWITWKAERGEQTAECSGTYWTEVAGAEFKTTKQDVYQKVRFIQSEWWLHITWDFLTGSSLGKWGRILMGRSMEGNQVVAERLHNARYGPGMLDILHIGLVISTGNLLNYLCL